MNITMKHGLEGWIFSRAPIRPLSQRDSGRVTSEDEYSNTPSDLHTIMQSDDALSIRNKSKYAPRESGPYFDPKSPKEIRIAVGKTAHISYMARNARTKPVKYFRFFFSF